MYKNYGYPHLCSDAVCPQAIDGYYNRCTCAMISLQDLNIKYFLKTAAAKTGHITNNWKYFWYKLVWKVIAFNHIIW